MIQQDTETDRHHDTAGQRQTDTMIQQDTETDIMIQQDTDRQTS